MYYPGYSPINRISGGMTINGGLSIQVKLWFYLVLLLPISAIAQNVGVRVGDGQPTESLKYVPGVGRDFIVSVPSASISFCQVPANGVPCTNKATTYTDSSLKYGLFYEYANRAFWNE